MKKFVKDLRIDSIDFLREDYILLRLKDTNQSLPPMLPGQFVQVAVENSPTTFLRRPISINDVDVKNNSFELLIHLVGDGTRALSKLTKGQNLNCIYPLGNGFGVPPIAEGKKKFENQEKLAINRYFHDFLMKYFENVVIPKKWRFVEKIPKDVQGKKQKLEIMEMFEGKK